jgi:Zn-dependent protease with chaperone function
MYTHLITFIAAILLFELYTPPPEAVHLAWGEFLAGIMATMVFFYFLVRLGFSRWLRRLEQKGVDARVIPFLHGSLVQRYVVLGVGVYALLLYVFHWKSFCTEVLGTGGPQFLFSLLGILPFLLVLFMIWAGSYSYAGSAYSPHGSFAHYLASQAKLHLVILIPWLGILILWDLFSFTSLGIGRRIQEDLVWSLCTLLAFILLLSWLFPVIVVRLWRCPPMPDGPVKRRLEAFFARNGFRHAGMVLWTLFEGSFSTAGILGLFAGTRYILLTPSLLQTLDEEELEAVMSHEMGHARHRHMLFYLIFIVGLTVVFDLSLEIITWLLSLGFLALEARGVPFDIWLGQPETASTVISILITIPSLILVILYFRYVFGVFSRNFERQSDLLALEIQKTSDPIIRSLNKISGFSPLVRVLPSWHHFSIQERIDFLKICEKRPELIKGHHRKVRLLVSIYLMTMVSLGGLLIGWRTQEWGSGWRLGLLQQITEKRLKVAPEDPSLWFALGSIAFEREDYDLAETALSESIKLEPKNAETLNNLAWLYATASERKFRKPQESLRLAKEAAQLQPTASHILDTLAEAYFINGMPSEALEVEETALSLASDRRDYYRKQVERFRKAMADSNVYPDP